MRRAAPVIIFFAAACGHHADRTAATPGPRIVSLAPSLTEIAFAIGAGTRLVGVDDYSMTPPAARRLPHIGPYLSPRVDDILALRPDLILCQAIQSDVASRLAAAGVAVATIDIQTIDDLRSAVLREGDLLGEATTARALVARIDGALARAKALPAPTPRPRVLVIIDREPGALRDLYAAGPGSYLDELLAIAGGDNALARAPLRFVKVGVEDILAGRPDVILDLSHTREAARAVRDWDALAQVPAVARHHVFLLDDPSFIAPGPDLPTALSKLSGVLRAATVPASEPLLPAGADAR